MFTKGLLFWQSLFYFIEERGSAKQSALQDIPAACPVPGNP